LSETESRSFRPARRALLAASGAALAAPPAQGATSRFFRTSDGVRLHYLVAGAGPTIAFIPGWCMPAWIFEPQIEALSRNYRVAVLDPRGQGRSEIPRTGYEPARRGRDVTEFVAELGQPRLVLAGWSLGVLDVLSSLNAAGDARLAGLLLIDNSIGEGEPPPARSGNFFRNLRTKRAETVRGFCAAMFRTPREASYLDALARDAQRMAVEDSIRLLSYPRPREFWRETLYGTRRPVLYAVRPNFRTQAELLAQRHPSAEVDIYETAGHALFVDEPARFNAAAERFLRQRARWT
jgi:microsomal epoxide hydrolase